MSTPPLPPEPPTEPLPPGRPPLDPIVEPVAAVREVPLADAYEVAALAESVRSLQNWVALLGVLSLFALALGGYALMVDDDDTGVVTGGVDSSAQVAELEGRIEALDEKIENSRSVTREDPDAADADQVSDSLSRKANASDLHSLERKVAALEANAGDGGSADSSQAIANLDQRLDQVERDVQELQTRQEEQP